MHLLLFASLSAVRALNVQDQRIGGSAADGVGGTPHPDAFGGLRAATLRVHDLELGAEEEIQKRACEAA